jgi:hypothetical protein
MGFRNAEWRAVVLDGTAGRRSTGKPVSAQSHYKAHRVALTAAASFNNAPDTGESTAGFGQVAINAGNGLR